MRWPVRLSAVPGPVRGAVAWKFPATHARSPSGATAQAPEPKKPAVQVGSSGGDETEACARGASANAARSVASAVRGRASDSTFSRVWRDALLDAEAVEQAFVAAPALAHAHAQVEEDAAAEQRLHLLARGAADVADHAPA